MIDIYWGDTKNFSVKSSSIKNTVIGLDRDGVINKEKGSIKDPDDFEPIKGSLEAIAQLKKLGYPVVILSNQSGISKGIITQDDVESVHEYMFKLLGEAGCPYIDGLYYSTSSHKHDYYAKPNTGMFERCERENLDIRFSGGYFVGDKISDLKAAIKTGATPVLVRTGHGAETENLLKRHTYRKIKQKTKVYDSLADFVLGLT
jgi:D-glycero-D-manno-heptose 1,7-bisphosphate phosphatase